MSQELSLLNQIFPLLMKRIIVPREYHDQVRVVKDMLKDDVSGLVDSLTDFAVESATVDFGVDAENPTLHKILNDWLESLNRSFNGLIPSGIKALAKEYFKERWKSSSFPILKIMKWEEGEQGLILPTQMAFVDGEDIYSDDATPEELDLKIINFNYFLGREKKRGLKDNVIITKPFARWYEEYPIPFLVKRGVYHNWKIIQSLKDKETEILDQVIPYLLLIKKGTEGLAINKDINYTNEQLIEITNQLKELIQKVGTSQLENRATSTKETPVRTTQFDEEIKHFIPDLSSIFSPDLFSQAERNILSGLGFVDVVESVSTSRRESVLNPKAFMREVAAGIEDFKQILKELVFHIKDANQDDHRKLMNVKTRITSGLVSDFMTDKFKERIRQLYDRGLLSKQTTVEIIGETEFLVEVQRRRQETDKGLEEDMYPPITDNREGLGMDFPDTPSSDEEILDDRMGPEAKNFDDAETKSNTGEIFSLKGKTSFDSGHEHEYEIDMEGNGQTSIDDDHKHPILEFIVTPGEKNGHIHNLLRSSALNLEGAPFSTIKELPRAIRDNMGISLQRVWMRVFNGAFDRTGSETSAFRQAWSVIRRVATKVKGRWVKKDSPEASSENTITVEKIHEICENFLEENVKQKKLDIAEKQSSLLDKLLGKSKENGK